MLLRAAPRGQTCARRRERLDEPLLGWPVAGIVRNRRNPMRASQFPRQIVHIRVLASRHALSEGGDVSHRNVITLAMGRSEEHTSELQSLMRISYAVFCLKKKNTKSRTKLYPLDCATDNDTNITTQLTTTP